VHGGLGQVRGEGVKKCSADGLETVCVASGGAVATVEICDGLDNDCDGQIDNGPNLCPKGQVCYMGTCVID